MSTKTRQPHDPTEDIKKAVEKLSAFNMQNETASVGSLQKTIDFMRDFLSAKFSDKSRDVQNKEREKNEFEILNAIDIIKSNYLLLEKLQKGSPQQQKLAASVLAVIERYNTIIDDAQVKPSSFAARIAAFFAEKNGSTMTKNLAKIHFPLHTFIHRDFTDKEKGAEIEPTLKKYSPAMNSPFIVASSKKISYLSQVVVQLTPLPIHEVPHLSKQGIELFYMKVIALVEKHGILSNTEARHAVRMAHLHTTINPESNACTVTCMLTPFPGQSIVVKGSFEKSPRSTEYTIPNAKSFQLTFTSTQTGFPHPSQHTGWALTDLVPNYPHQLDELPLLKPLYELKQKFAHELLSNEPLIEKSRQRLRLKKQAFEKNKEQMISLHKQVCQSLIAAAPKDLIPLDTNEVVDQFFARLGRIQNSYDYLAETYHIINASFVMRPQERLKQAWIERGQTDFAAQVIMNNEMAHVMDELHHQSQLTASDLEKCTIDFILKIGQILGKSSQNILLQQMSESMNFAPPMLNDFELKIQTIVYKQLKGFLYQSSQSSIEEIEEKLLSQLEADIAVLTSDSFKSLEETDPEAQIVKELEAYYNTRYYTKA